MPKKRASMADMPPESSFTRKPVPLPGPTPEAEPSDTRRCPPPVSIEAVLPEWVESLPNEKWDSGEGGAFVDHSFATDQLPAHLKASVAQWLRPVDVLNPEPPKPAEEREQSVVPAGSSNKKDAKRKEEKKQPSPPPPTAKKGKEEPEHVWVEKETDDIGRTLPKVLLNGGVVSGNCMGQKRIAGGRALTRDFARTWSLHQLEMFQKLAMHGSSEEPIDPMLTPPTVPDGDEFDSVFASVIRVIEALAETLLPSGEPFLWENIYPKTQDGKPVYNPGGKYCVRLWAGGKWRKVVVDDRLPFTFDKKPVLLSSEEPRELWPSLLAKAVYKLYHLTGARALFPDILASTDALAGFVSYALHALGGVIISYVPSLLEPEAMLTKLKDAGTYVDDVQKMQVDKTPWMSIEAGKAPPKRKFRWSRPKRRNKQKKLRIFFDEVEASRDAQQAQLDAMAAHVAAPERTQVFIVCYIEMPKPPPSPAIVTPAHSRAPSSALVDFSSAIDDLSNLTSSVVTPPVSHTALGPRRAVIKPVLAVATNQHPKPVTIMDAPTNVEVLPKVLTSFACRMPQQDVQRDENGAAVHKRVKGDPSVYWPKLVDTWIPLVDLLALSPTIICFEAPKTVLYKAQYHLHWSIPTIATTTTITPVTTPSATTSTASTNSNSVSNTSSGQSNASAMTAQLEPPQTPPPVFLHIPPAQRPTKLAVGLLKDRPAPPSVDGGLYDPADEVSGDTVVAYLQEVELPRPQSDATSALSAAQAPLDAAGDHDMQLRAAHTEDGAPASMKPVLPVLLPVHLDVLSALPFACGVMMVPPSDTGRLYRLQVHAPLGTSVQLASDGRIQVGDPVAMWKASMSLGSVVSEQAAYESVSAGQPKVLFRRIVKVEPTSAETYTRLHLYLKDDRGARFVRLCVTNNDTGEETVVPSLQTGYLRWDVNTYGYTITATYLSHTTALRKGTFRLLIFSTGSLVQPLIKADTEMCTRYTGTYTANKYLRLLRDQLLTTMWPLSLRLTVSDPDTYLRLRVLADGINDVVVDLRGRRVVTLHSLSFNTTLSDTAQMNEASRYILDVSIDEENMEVPAERRSLRPYYFSQAPADTTTSVQTPTRSLPLDWTLDVISSAQVMLVHDQTDLTRFASVRSAWEAAQPGRAERAKKVRELWHKSKGPAEGKPTPSQRVEAVGGSLAVQRETIREQRRADLVAPTVEVLRPVDVVKDVTVVGDLDMLRRLDRQKEVLGSSAASLAEQAAARKAALTALVAGLKEGVTSQDALRKASAERRSDVWALREAKRAAQVTKIMEEVARAEEAQAAAAEAAKPHRGKKKGE